MCICRIENLTFDGGFWVNPTKFYVVICLFLYVIHFKRVNKSGLTPKKDFAELDVFPDNRKKPIVCGGF